MEEVKVTFFYKNHVDLNYFSPIARFDSDVRELAERCQRYMGIITDLLSCDELGCCDLCIADIELVMAGKLDEFNMSGNISDVDVTANGVQVSITLDEKWCDQPEGFFSLDQWHQLMLLWREFLAKGKVAGNVVKGTIQFS